MMHLKFILLAALGAGLTSCQTATKESEPSANAKVQASREVKSASVRAKHDVKIAAVSTAKTKGETKSKGEKKPEASVARVLHDVKTTAYTHSEKDHLKHGKSNALDSTLKFGEVRSAAADWSDYPVGTKFKIEGEPYVYVVDDYGSALVGTRTIDLYKPSIASVKNWGVKKVNINVLQWGSFDRSLSILKTRDTKTKGAVHRMVSRLKDSKSDVATSN